MRRGGRDPSAADPKPWYTPLNPPAALKPRGSCTGIWVGEMDTDGKRCHSGAKTAMERRVQQWVVVVGGLEGGRQGLPSDMACHHATRHAARHAGERKHAMSGMQLRHVRV
jgi:hypothetical protein